jgi:hypothetical protein
VSRELHLLPSDGEPHPSPDETLQRLRAEFRFVETDRELGRADLLPQTGPDYEFAKAFLHACNMVLGFQSTKSV